LVSGNYVHNALPIRAVDANGVSFYGSKADKTHQSFIEGTLGCLLGGTLRASTRDRCLDVQFINIEGRSEMPEPPEMDEFLAALKAFRDGGETVVRADLAEFCAALRTEMEKSPEIVPEYVAAQQSWAARRHRRDAIIAERGRLYDASKRLLAVEIGKLSPRDYLEHRDDARRRELEELRSEWWRVVNEMWPVPPTDFERIMCETREFRWGLLIVAALALVWFLMR
jgi:hypothetical protein